MAKEFFCSFLHWRDRQETTNCLVEHKLWDFLLDLLPGVGGILTGGGNSCQELEETHRKEPGSLVVLGHTAWVSSQPSPLILYLLCDLWQVTKLLCGSNSSL